MPQTLCLSLSHTHTHTHTNTHTHTHTLTSHLPYALVEGGEACQCGHPSGLSVGVQHVRRPLQGEDVGAGGGGQAHDHKHPQRLKGVFRPIERDEVEAAVDHACTGES